MKLYHFIIKMIWCIHIEGNIYWAFPVYQTLNWPLSRGAHVHRHPVMEWISPGRFSRRKYAPHKQKSHSVWECVPDEIYARMSFLTIVKQFNLAQRSWILESERCGFNGLWTGDTAIPKQGVLCGNMGKVFQRWVARQHGTEPHAKWLAECL